MSREDLGAKVPWFIGCLGSLLPSRMDQLGALFPMHRVFPDVWMPRVIVIPAVKVLEES